MKNKIIRVFVNNNTLIKISTVASIYSLKYEIEFAKTIYKILEEYTKKVPILYFRMIGFHENITEAENSLLNLKEVFNDTVFVFVPNKTIYKTEIFSFIRSYFHKKIQSPIIILNNYISSYIS